MGLRSALSLHLPAQQQDTGRCQPQGERGEHQACPNPALRLDSELTTGPARLGSRHARHSLTRAPDRQSLAAAQPGGCEGVLLLPLQPVPASLQERLSTRAVLPSICVGREEHTKLKGISKQDAWQKCNFQPCFVFFQRPSTENHHFPQLLTERVRSIKSDICFPHQNHSASTEANGTQKQP